MRRFGAARIALIYVAVATVWILTSDQIALTLMGDAARLTSVQTLKGVAFVAVSGALIHLLVRRERRRWRAAEAAAQQAARRFEAIFRASPAGILIADVATGRYVDVNDRFLAMFGHARDDLIGVDPAGLHMWAEPERRTDSLRTISHSGRVLDQIDLFRRRDGSLRTMLWSAERIQMDGRPQVVASMVDLTDQRDAYEQTLEGWARALDLRDHETADHTQRVARLTEALARRAGLPEDELVELRWGALLHDIGKIGVPDAILNKPGPLNEREWAVMRRHPSVAGELLRPISFLAEATDIPAYHHERWDGSGYPHGLSGHELPRSARIFAVVDVWDALTNDRPYRKAWSREAARKHLQDESGRLFDPEVVAAFLPMMDAGEA